MLMDSISSSSMTSYAPVSHTSFPSQHQQSQNTAPTTQIAPTPPPRPPLPPPMAPPPRDSSPLAAPEDEEEMREAFWGLKLQKTTRKEALLNIKEIIDDNMWDSTHLQRMSNMSSELYKIAIEKGIPDGFLRNIREDLHRFKDIWRAGGVLNQLARAAE